VRPSPARSVARRRRVVAVDEDAVGPGVEVRRFDAQRPEDRVHLRAVLGAVGDKLREDRRGGPAAVPEREELVRRRERINQRFEVGRRAFGHDDEFAEFRRRWGGIRAPRPLRQVAVVGVLARQQVGQRLADAAVHPLRAGVEHLRRHGREEREQFAVRPVVVVDEALEVGAHRGSVVDDAAPGTVGSGPVTSRPGHFHVQPRLMSTCRARRNRPRR